MCQHNLIDTQNRRLCAFRNFGVFKSILCAWVRQSSFRGRRDALRSWGIFRVSPIISTNCIACMFSHKCRKIQTAFCLEDNLHSFADHHHRRPCQRADSLSISQAKFCASCCVASSVLVRAEQRNLRSLMSKAWPSSRRLTYGADRRITTRCRWAKWSSWLSNVQMWILVLACDEETEPDRDCIAGLVLQVHQLQRRVWIACCRRLSLQTPFISRDVMNTFAAHMRWIPLMSRYSKNQWT